MQIRKLKPEEHVYYKGISCSVFHGLERKDIREMMKNPLDHQDKAEAERWGYFGDDNCLHSAVTVIPYTIRMNGKEIKMAGIGDVVTRPQSRGAGCVRQIFDKVFPDMLESGQIFSFLYPFSYEYYRKLGYEVCLSYSQWSFPTEQLSKFKYPKNVEAHQPGDDAAPYVQIYEAFAEGRNLSAVRNQKSWDELLKRDPYKKLEFTFLVRDDFGKGIAYVMYSRANSEGENGDRIMDIKELCWATPDGLHQILGFLGKLTPEFDKVKWNATCDINVHALCNDPYVASAKVIPAGMGRVVDVKAGLEMLAAPKGSGKVCVDIADKYLTQNSGTYAIEWEDGNLSVVKSQSATADMSTTVETLAQLIPGYLAAGESVYKPCTTIHNAHENLSILFPKKRLYLAERF